MPSYNPYEQKILGLERQQKLAEQLRNAQMPEGQMVGGHYVAANPLGQLGALLRQYAGIEMEDKAKKGIEAARAEQGQALKDWQASMPKTHTEEMAGPAFEGVAPTRTTKPTAEDYMGWAQQGLAIDPTAAQMGMQSANMQLTREQNAQNLQAKLIEAQQKRQDDYAQQERMARINMEGRQDLARLAAALRPEKMVTVMDANGNPVTVPQSQMGGMNLYNPQAAKQIQAEKVKGTAREEMSGVVQQLRNNYDALKQGGGIVTQGGGTSNIAARLSQSGIGQFVGGAIGSANQTERQKIEQTRPLLLNLIKNATGMSAQQMNSNAEMQLYLKAATDPTLSYEANMSALDNLDRLYGLGINKPSASNVISEADAILQRK